MVLRWQAIASRLAGRLGRLPASRTVANWLTHSLVRSLQLNIGAEPTIAGANLRATAPVDIHAVDTLMLRLIETYNVPGAALALIKGGGVVLEKGYGSRDLNTHAPVTAQTLFNIGSISKSFTALAIAQLVDHHKLDLDTPIIGCEW